MIDSKARMPVMRHDVRGARQPQRRAVWLRRSPSSLAQGGSPDKQFLTNQTPRRGRRKPFALLANQTIRIPHPGQMGRASRISGLPLTEKHGSKCPCQLMCYGVHFFIAWSVCSLTWCSMPSLSIWAVCSSTPKASKNSYTMACRFCIFLASAAPDEVKVMG